VALKDAHLLITLQKQFEFKNRTLTPISRLIKCLLDDLSRQEWYSSFVRAQIARDGRNPVNTFSYFFSSGLVGFDTMHG
jgi:hypothetical protein